jgi:hypothetical protein
VASPTMVSLEEEPVMFVIGIDPPQGVAHRGGARRHRTEALRALKRRISDAVWRQLQADARS